MYLEANGNIIIDSKNGGLVISSDNDHDPYGLTTTKLTVSQKATFTSEAEFFNTLKARDISTEKDIIVGGGLEVTGNATFNGTVTFNKGISFSDTGIEMRDLKLTNWLVVGDDSTKGSETTSFNTKTSFNGTENFFASGFSANGTSSMDTIKFNNIESNNAYNAVGVKCGIEMYGNVMVNDGSPHIGATTTINIDGQTLRFVKGILV